MTRRDALRTLRTELPQLVASYSEGEWRVTFRPHAILARYPGLRGAAATRKAESLAYYTSETDDMLGTARAMVVAWNARAAA